MKKNLTVLAAFILLAGFAWADPPKGTVPKGTPPKVGPAQPHFRGDFVPAKRARPPHSYQGVKKPRHPHKGKRVPSTK